MCFVGKVPRFLNFKAGFSVQNCELCVTAKNVKQER